MDCETPDLTSNEPRPCKWCGGHIRNCAFCREDKTLRQPGRHSDEVYHHVQTKRSSHDPMRGGEIGVIFESWSLEGDVYIARLWCKDLSDEDHQRSTRQLDETSRCDLQRLPQDAAAHLEHFYFHANRQACALPHLQELLDHAEPLPKNAPEGRRGQSRYPRPGPDPDVTRLTRCRFPETMNTGASA